MEDLHKSVDESFINNKNTMFPNDAWIKEPVKGEDRTEDFRVTEYKIFLDLGGFRFHSEINL